jgi:hypothetical protein
MKFRILSACALAACVCVLAGATGVAARPRASAAAQDNQGKQPDLKISGGERDAADKINKAKGAEAKLQAASEFVKKYPKSALRPRIAEAVAAEINGTQDNQLRISLGETYVAIFNEPGEAEHVRGTLLATYLDAEQAEQAFKAAPAWLEKHPEDVDSYRRLAILGSNAAIRGDDKYVAQARQYGEKAVELIEADKKPADVDAAKWADYKAKMLPGLYRETGILALRTGEKAAARARLEKAVALNTPDPSAYALVGQFADEEYTGLVNEYKIASGPSKDAAFKKAQAQLDKVIELYAQAVALTEGRPEYQPLKGQVMPALEDYYKFRHNGSTDGLQQLIDKYKKPAAAQ